MLKKTNLAHAFGLFEDAWNPKIVAEINDMQLKLVKLRGEFVWHLHEREDELFLVVDGELVLQLRDGNVALSTGEFIVIPRGVEHKPRAVGECRVILLEPSTTVNTGNSESDRTVKDVERLDV